MRAPTEAEARARSATHVFDDVKNCSIDLIADKRAGAVQRGGGGTQCATTTRTAAVTD